MVSIPSGVAVENIIAYADCVQIVGSNGWCAAVGPDADLSALPDDVRDAIAALITPEMIAAYEASRAGLYEGGSATTLVPDDVRAEAQRRIIALTGAADLEGCIIKQLNATVRATELNDLRLSGAELTPAEEAEAQALRDLAAEIKAVRAASNILEASDPVPADYRDDAHWA